jgi:hypothetical protein
MGVAQGRRAAMAAARIRAAAAAAPHPRPGAPPASDLARKSAAAARTRPRPNGPPACPPRNLSHGLNGRFAAGPAVALCGGRAGFRVYLHSQPRLRAWLRARPRARGCGRAEVRVVLGEETSKTGMEGAIDSFLDSVKRRPRNDAPEIVVSSCHAGRVLSCWARVSGEHTALTQVLPVRILRPSVTRSDSIEGSIHWLANVTYISQDVICLVYTCDINNYLLRFQMHV